MIPASIITGLKIFQIILQGFAAFLSYRISVKANSYVWRIFMVGFALMTLRRLTALLTGLEVLPKFDGLILQLDQAIIPLLISVIFATAIFNFYKGLNG